jgi:restriction system protein
MTIWEYGDYADFGTGLEVDIEGELNYLKNFECGGFSGEFHDISDANLGLKNILESATCQYCQEPLHTTKQDLSDKITEKGQYHRANIRVCRGCGWWTLQSTRSVYTENQVGGGYAAYTLTKGAGGVLKRLDLSDLSIPLAELRQYLLARYSDRFSLNPRLFEEIVGGVFADFGYRVRVTSYSGDHGIDVAALEGDSGDTVGIQVKRYRGTIQAEQVRSLAGALVLGGFTKGVFVTTSEFSRGARSTAARFDGLGTPIQLIDADRFLELLSVAQHNQGNVDPGDVIPGDVWSALDDLTAMEFETFVY